MSNWSIREFVKCFEGKQLIKPRIQRLKRWKDDDNRDYVLFLLKWRESAMPFLLNERIVDSQKVYYLFDGNNRANAILDFVLKPLFFFGDLIPKVLPETVKELLHNIPLAVLTKPRYNLAKLYREYELKMDAPTLEQDEQFEELLVQVDGWKFLDVHLSMTIKQNLTDEEMCSLYTSINKGGKVLSKQELLASITFPVKYYAADLGTYYQPFVANITSYYGDMCIHEKLNVEQFGSNSLTLFEVLVAFQMYLSQTYHFILPYSGEEEKDVVFSLYEFFGGPIDRRWEDLLPVLTQVHEACALLNECYAALYDPALKLNRQVRLRKFAAILILVFIIYHRQHFQDAGFVATVRRILVYHELVHDLPSDDSREQFVVLDPLRVGAAGVFSKRYLNSLKEKQTFERIPTLEETIAMVKHILISDTHYTSTRKRTSRVKAIALSAFFNFQIPSHRKLETQDIDHIIPYSTKRRHTIDVCRLGNLQLIPSTINRVRQTKPITDRWVLDNDLKYQCYPTQGEYEAICSDAVVMDADAFNEMCERREELYLKQISRLLG